MLECEHCLASATGNLRSKDLSLEEWKQIFAELPEIDARKVLLTGGEPLLFKELAELTAFISDLGVSTDLNSTFWSLSPQKATELTQAGLTEASIALEGPPRIHDEMHGRDGAHERLCAGVRMLQDSGVIVDGSMCVTPLNLAFVDEVIDEAVRLNLGSFTISRMMPVGHGLRYVGPTLSSHQLAELHSKIADARAGSRGISVRCVGLLGAPLESNCHQGRSLIGIRANGRIAPCVLSRDTCGGLPLPGEVGLKEAFARMQLAVEKLDRPLMCYGANDIS